MKEWHLKSWGLLTVCVTAGAISTLGVAAEESRWPAIRPLHETRTFVDPGRDNVDTPFLALIRSTAGVPLYKFECHNGNYDGSSEINFSGDFQCALFSLKGDSIASGDLLAANTRNEQSTDWWNRGRMRSAQLREPCLAFPEYSTNRRFKLRGMLVTMRFSGIEWSSQRDQQKNPMLGKFTFTFDVIPDNEARSPRAEVPVGPAPPRSCYP